MNINPLMILALISNLLEQITALQEELKTLKSTDDKP